MRDGVPLTTDGSSHYTLSQTVSHRPTSTYHNVLMIKHTAPGVAGNYTCTVSNDLGSHSMSVVVIGKLQGIFKPSIGILMVLVCFFPL